VLRELRIENLLLIERAELRLGDGLNAITGETGAGKTVLAHSLDLLMGGKARPQIVRPGAKEAWVEGVFDLPEGLLGEPELAGIAERLPKGSDEVVLGRRVSAGGRTSAFVAGRAASAGDLKLLGGWLLAFYGQHEHRKLAISSAQTEVLDGFAGAEHLEVRRLYLAAHREFGALASELAALREREGSRERDLDLFRYELSEIDEVAPEPAEDGELGAERERLRHAEGLREAAAGAYAGIAGIDEDGGAVSALAQAEALLKGASGVDADLDSISERLSALSVDLADVAAELRDYPEGLEADSARLANVEERLHLLDRLKRKHGGSVESVLSHAERCREEISRLEGGEERISGVEDALGEAQRRRGELGAQLSEGRARAAGPLEKEMAKELQRLAMPGAILEVVLESQPDGFGAGGRETVELRVAPNPGINPAPLRDVASGGELSRIMLALSGLGEGAGAGTLVFDEIDAGVGGHTARVVGERLRALSDDRQVLCITHLPQVASMASTHFRIEKDVTGERAVASVQHLDGEDVVEEICRMLGGEGSDEGAARHARELLAAA